MLIDREKMLVLPFRKAASQVAYLVTPEERTQSFVTVITGFNTDIEHGGVVYHVQTEDKGLDTPIILSLVYAGGTILASKRSPYEDLIAAGFSDEVLAERLKRQHKLICAAIHSGRIDDLKKMTRPAKRPVAESVTAEPVVEQPELVVEEPEVLVAEAELVAEPVIEEFEFEYGPITQEWTPPPPAPPVEEAIVETVEETAVPEAEEVVATDEHESEPVAIEEPLADGLVIALLDDEEFYSGEKY